MQIISVLCRENQKSEEQVIFWYFRTLISTWISLPGEGGLIYSYFSSCFSNFTQNFHWLPWALRVQKLQITFHSLFANRLALKKKIKCFMTIVILGELKLQLHLFPTAFEYCYGLKVSAISSKILLLRLPLLKIPIFVTLASFKNSVLSPSPSPTGLQNCISIRN